MPDDDAIKLILDTSQSVDNVEKLLLQVGALKDRLRLLADEYKSGNRTDEEYLTQTRLVKDELKARTEILKNLTDAEKSHIETVKAAAPAYDAATQAVIEQTRQQANMRDMLEEVEPVLGRVGNTDEGGKGFGGLAGGILKAEKVAMAIGTGGGLARIGPMLESITSALGLAGGAGLAAGGLLYALEGIIPKILKFLDVWDAEKLKAQADAIAHLREEYLKYQAALSGGEEETKKRVEEFTKLSGEKVVLGGIQASLRSEGFGADPEQEAKMAALADMPGMTPARLAQMRVQLDKARDQKIKDEATRIRQQAPTDPAQRARLVSMAIKRPRNFPTGFAEGLAEQEPEAFEAAEAKATEEEAETVAMGDRLKAARQRLTKEENARIDARNKARKERQHRTEARQKAEDAGIIQQADIAEKAETGGQKDIQRIVGEATASGIRNTRNLAKSRDNELYKLGGEDIKTRQMIAKVREDAHQTKMMFGQGLITVEQMQATVARDQTLFNQLQERLKRIEQRERVLNARQTTLTKPSH